MKVSELISIINTYGVKVAFDNPEMIANNLREGQVMYFAPLAGYEIKKYKRSKHQERFISKTAIIHIPDLTIEDLINVFECDGTGIHEITRTIIKPYYNKAIPTNIVFVSFLFLHEVGHWMQFKEMGNNVYAFVNLDYETKRANFEKQLSLKQRFLSFTEANNTTEFKDLIDELHKNMIEYRNIPCEKQADDFAHSHILDALNAYQKYMNNLS